MDIEKDSSGNNYNNYQSSQEYQELLAQNQELKLENEKLKLENQDRQVRGLQRQQKIDRLIRGIYYLVGALVILLFLRFLLLLFGANTENMFANFILNFSNPFAMPFANLFNNPEFGGKFILEITTIVGILVYSLLAWLVVSLINVIDD